MRKHAIISHGLHSSPEAAKAMALAQVAHELGWSTELPDYRDLDAIGELGDVAARIARLEALAARVDSPLVLAGSSMGAFISARVSLQRRVLGLFLMAPPTQLLGSPLALEAASVPTRIVHGWHDELIPAAEVVRWASMRSDRLLLVDDKHRLTAHVELCAQEFGRFLQALA
ncbi:MAG: YqiA/YcfP family alpha/beta fold hydrolase [Arenimonas sp.]